MSDDFTEIDRLETDLQRLIAGHGLCAGDDQAHAELRRIDAEYDQLAARIGPSAPRQVREALHRLRESLCRPVAA